MDNIEVLVSKTIEEDLPTVIKRSNLNIEPIIVNNDKYSVSAIYSVQEGDTLENRLAECNCSAKYI